MYKFKFLKALFSPFKLIYPKFYMGKIAVGTPYFYPRRWVIDKGANGRTAVPKKIGFDFVGLGWKTKWCETDFRYEWSPVWSFVFFKWQIAVIWNPKKNKDHYWECWLIYHYATDKNKTVRERIKQARKINSQKWTSSYLDKKGEKVEEEVCYWDKVLKSKYV